MVNKDGCRKPANLLSIQVWETSLLTSTIPEEASGLYQDPTLPDALLNTLMCVWSVAQSCPTLCDPHGLAPLGSSVHEIFQARNTGVGSHSLLQRIFLTQG